MNVLILAAGVGRRLHPLTEQMPKPLLSVGQNTLLGHQLEALADAGVRTEAITLVGGHGYERLVAWAPAGVRTVFNPKYDSWNNIYSITLGELSNGSTLLVNGDGLYHPSIFRRALAHPAPDFLVTDTQKTLGAEEMKARFEDGALVALAKSLPIEQADGEYIGISRFSAPTFQRIRDVAAELVAQGETDCWYESAILQVANERRIEMLDIGGMPWTEVDDPRDLAHATALAAQPGMGGS